MPKPDRGDEADPPRVEEIPLFPLNVVLFPHMPLPLHIFEPRYKAMVTRCLDENRSFGVALIRDDHGTDTDPGVGTFRVGCSARIAHVDQLEDGTMNLYVVGEHRFRIVDTHDAQPYRTALIVPLADSAAADAATVVPLADAVQRLLRDFLTRSLALAGQPIDDFELPDEPEQLSFTAACVLPIDNAEKQALLEEVDTAARLATERGILLREVTRLRRASASASESTDPPATGAESDEDDEPALALEQVSAAVFSAYRCQN